MPGQMSVLSAANQLHLASRPQLASPASSSMIGQNTVPYPLQGVPGLISQPLSMPAGSKPSYGIPASMPYNGGLVRSDAGATQPHQFNFHSPANARPAGSSPTVQPGALPGIPVPQGQISIPGLTPAQVNAALASLAQRPLQQGFPVAGQTAPGLDLSALQAQLMPDPSGRPANPLFHIG